MPPKKHARLGASSSKRWMACPGSPRESDGKPNPSSVYSREGSAAHDLAERVLKNDAYAMDFLGMPIEVPDEDGTTYEVEVTEEMAESVQQYVDHLNLRDEVVGNDGVHTLEVQFDLSPLKPPEPMFGTADHTVWYPRTKTLYVDDYKHGAGVVVEAVGNTQGLIYALGAVVALRVRPERIVITIVQPRAFHKAGPIRSWEITWEELVEFKQRLFEAAERTQDPDAELVAGDHCRFCPGAPTCPAQRSLALTVAQEDFMSEDFEATSLASPDAMTMDDIKFVLDNAPQVEAWFNSIRAYAEAQLNAGQEVPGYKLVPGRANRRWADEAKAERWLVRRIGKKGALKKKLLTVAQAEAALKKEGIALKGSLVEKPEGKPRLAPADNPAPALPPEAITDFDGI